MSITSPIFNLFTRSPIKPLQQHIDKVFACTERLNAFTDAVLSDDWEKATSIQHDIAKLEDDADAIKRDLRLHLPNSLFMPVARNDVLELLHMQDRIANKAEDIAGLVIGRKMMIPDAIKLPYKTLVSRSVDAAKQAHQAIKELDELFETGFKGNEAKLVSDMIVKLDEIEHDTDKMQRDLHAKVFALENALPPVEVMFLYKLIEWTGDLADRAQTAGGRLLLLLAR